MGLPYCPLPAISRILRAMMDLPGMEENGAMDGMEETEREVTGAPAGEQMGPGRGSVYRILLPLLLLFLAGGALALWWWRGSGGDGEGGRPGILYLAWDEAEQPQLFLTRDMGETTRQLTEAERGVQAYAPSPDGQRIAYSTGRADGGADIWLVTVEETEARLLLGCEEAVCSNPVWRPDGRLLLYERREVGNVDEEAALPRLYWLDLDNGESVPLFQEEEAWGQQARFSADGRWLAYVMPLWQQVRVVNVQTNEIVTIANDLGESVVWHPRLPAFLFTDMFFYQGESFVTHIYRADLPEAGELPEEGALPEENVTSLSGEGGYSDSAPSWSPDGSRLAFGRKLPGTPTGRQIWVMDGDGGNQQRVTENVTLQFSRPLWLPDGERLLVQRFNIETPAEPPGIWLVDVGSGRLEEVVTPGFQAIPLPGSANE